MTILIYAFLLTTIAGLSTGIGALLAFVSKKENASFLSVSMGFSAGVMIYVSFMELLPTSQSLLETTEYGQWLSLGLFFLGVGFIGLIDGMIPEYENPHDFFHTIQDMKGKKWKLSLLRMGLLSALVITIHNFPEGFATFISVLNNPITGMGIVLAIALHNIPEGIAVSVPIFYATGNRLKAFWYSFLSGLSEPLGALVGYFFIYPFLNDAVMGGVFSFVAGIMVYISLDELLPAAREYGKNHLSICGVFAGMLVMGG
ncbi:MAG: zinc transporter ZupT, partial [Alphaproteobacteria bacterium]|nr:zinc transporter ZupT [Alphaproteobacteria bacterium]